MIRIMLTFKSEKIINTNTFSNKNTDVSFCVQYFSYFHHTNGGGGLG